MQLKKQKTKKTCAESVPALLPMGYVLFFPQEPYRGALAPALPLALAPALTNTHHHNVIKLSLQGNEGHLVQQHAICHGNLDYEVSCETPDSGQGCVSVPSEGCWCVGICVSGERVCWSPVGFFFILWPTAGERTYTPHLLWLIQIKPRRQWWCRFGPNAHWVLTLR